MSLLADTFLSGIGRPTEPAPNGLRFQNPVDDQFWKELQQEIGSGWYFNRFLYLFGAGLEKLLPCVEAWSFIAEPGVERMVVGRNAYGAILIAEEPSKRGFVCPVRLLDPLNVRYWGAPDLDFSGLIGNWLPQDRVPNFLDRSLYDAYVKVTGDYLDFDEILGIKEPLSLGGKMAADNFQIENIVEYYQSTGPIYAKAFEKKK